MDYTTHMDNPNIRIGEREGFGKALYAIEDIAQDTVIAEFDGEIFQAQKCTDLPKDIADHAIQIGEHTWKESRGFARYINHSCDPNCGIRGTSTLVTMKPIKRGEELTWDYDMTEDSDWRLACKCGTAICRGIIGAYEHVPQRTRERYGTYVSEWLREKYS